MACACDGSSKTFGLLIKFRVGSSRRSRHIYSSVEVDGEETRISRSCFNAELDRHPSENSCQKFPHVFLQDILYPILSAYRCKPLRCFIFVFYSNRSSTTPSLLHKEQLQVLVRPSLPALSDFCVQRVIMRVSQTEKLQQRKGGKTKKRLYSLFLPEREDRTACYQVWLDGSLVSDPGLAYWSPSSYDSSCGSNWDWVVRLLSFYDTKARFLSIHGTETVISMNTACLHSYFPNRDPHSHPTTGFSLPLSDGEKPCLLQWIGIREKF